MTPPTPPAVPLTGRELWLMEEAFAAARYSPIQHPNAADWLGYIGPDGENDFAHWCAEHAPAPPTPPGGLLTGEERAMLEAGLGDNDGVRCGEIMAEIIPAEYGRGIAKAFCRYLLAADARLRTAP
jgi:hypothetical protein